MSERLFAVVDQGSTSTKGGVFRQDGERVQLATVPVERSVDGPHVEHDPEALARGVVEIVETLAEEYPLTAIGLACQRSTCLVWERDSAEPLTPALSWQDRSQAARVESLAAHADLVRRRTGLRLTPYYAAPKLGALLDQVPLGAGRAAAGELVAGTLDAFLVHRLTGRPATEAGIAGRTLLYSLEADAWDEELCELFGVPMEVLPELRTSAGEWGEAAGVPLVAVAGDQQASLIGHGGWKLGVTAAHFGTGAFVLASTGEEVVRHEGLLAAVLASTPSARRFQIEGSVNSAGSAVDWARELTGEDLEAWADRALAPEGPLVLPSFTGTAAPWWESSGGAVVADLELSTSGEELFAAVLRGVAHRILDNVEALDETGIETTVLRVSGKLTRLSGMVQFLADAGEIPVEVAAEEETGSLGMVRLMAAHLDGDERPLLEPPAASERYEPRWSSQKAGRARRRWSEFARAAMRL